MQKQKLMLKGFFWTFRLLVFCWVCYLHYWVLLNHFICPEYVSFVDILIWIKFFPTTYVHFLAWLSLYFLASNVSLYLSLVSDIGDSYCMCAHAHTYSLGSNLFDVTDCAFLASFLDAIIYYHILFCSKFYRNDKLYLGCRVALYFTKVSSCKDSNKLSLDRAGMCAFLNNLVDNIWP